MRKRRKLFLTLKNNRNNRIRFPKFRFRNIAGRFHNHTKHGSEWGESKLQQEKFGDAGAGATSSTARGEEAPEDFREEGRGKAMGGSPTGYLLKAGVN